MTARDLQGGRRLAFGSLLFVAMGVAIFAASSLGILASFIIDDFGISRTQLGIAIGVMTISAALLSPIVGRVTDRVGGRTSLILLFVAAAVFYLTYGFAPAYFVLLVGGLAGAFASASSNPATNKLIAEELPLGQRSVITGVKQSGVQAGIFVGGLTVPSIALALGWRAAYLMIAVLPISLVFATMVILPPREAKDVAGEEASSAPLPDAIRWLTLYGFLMGFSGAVTFLVPLYAEEVLGFDPRLAGAVAATIAAVAVFGRIAWGRLAERTGRYRGTLGVMALISVGSSTAFWLAGVGPAWIIWIAACAIALGSGSWNSVGMLSLMADAGVEATGRASGIVLFGFLSGLGIAPVVFGAVVDQSGSYAVVWLLSAASAGLAFAVVFLWRRSAASLARTV